MKIGLVKEIKDKENRVALIPEGVQKLIRVGHSVLVEQDAGCGSGFSNAEYLQAGAEIVAAEDAWDVDLVVKVKEPMEEELQYLGRQMVFTFFHLAGVPRSLTETLLARKTTAVAYETLENQQGRLSILAPMSAIAGNMAAVMGSYYLATFNQGKGVQLGNVLGKSHGKVVILGDGVVGQHAALVANSMGANVYITALNEQKGRKLTETILSGVEFFTASQENICAHVIDADLVIGAVLRRGEKAPFVVSEAMIKHMQAGSVVVDVSIDQGGCIETSRPTSHSDPVFIKYDVIHYCVTNMPGAYPRTSTLALTEATLPYVLNLANNGLAKFTENSGLAKAVNVFDGHITCRPVASALDLMDQYKPLERLI